MIEVHALPTADTYSATYYAYSGGVKQAAVSLNKVVLIERSGILESGLPGLKRFVQISSTYLVTTPKHGEQIVIDSKTYKLNNPLKRKNPAFVMFWESEIQIVK